jgi:hypothetical protein
LPALELQKSIKEEIELQCKNEKVPVAMLESGSCRPPLTEAEKSDRIETDQRIWRVVSGNSKTVRHIDIRCRADIKAE